MPHERGRLAHLRAGIDGVDDVLVAGVALRRALVARVARIKRMRGLPVVDGARESAVLARARRVGARLGVPEATVDAVLAAVIADAHRAQGLPADLDQGAAPPTARMIAPAMPISSAPASWLRLLPPPSRLAPLVRRLPVRLQRRLVERAVAVALAAPVADGLLDFMRGRRIGIDVTDLGIGWTFGLLGDRLVTLDEAAEASVRGSATDLLLLAARLEDADTLFFQRRLVLTGDTELGLTARNVLDRLPWERVPLPLRILLHRAARFARDARDAAGTGR